MLPCLVIGYVRRVAMTDLLGLVCYTGFTSDGKHGVVLVKKAVIVLLRLVIS